MAKTKLSFRGLSIPEKVARGREIIKALTGNAHFSSPQPTLTAITTTIDALEDANQTAQAARQEAKTRTIQQNQKEDNFDQAFKRLAAYVESVSGDDEELITSAGFDLRSPATVSADLPAPQGLTATAGDHDGEIDLHWDRVNGARSYLIQRSTDPTAADSWQQVAVSTRSSVTIEGLTSGTKYWFRVASIGSQGQSGWSNPVARIAP